MFAVVSYGEIRDINGKWVDLQSTFSELTEGKIKRGREHHLDKYLKLKSAKKLLSNKDLISDDDARIYQLHNIHGHELRTWFNVFNEVRLSRIFKMEDLVDTKVELFVLVNDKDVIMTSSREIVSNGIIGIHHRFIDETDQELIRGVINQINIDFCQYSLFYTKGELKNLLDLEEEFYVQQIKVVDEKHIELVGKRRNIWNIFSERVFFDQMNLVFTKRIKPRHPDRGFRFDHQKNESTDFQKKVVKKYPWLLLDFKTQYELEEEVEDYFDDLASYSTNHRRIYNKIHK